MKDMRIRPDTKGMQPTRILAPAATDSVWTSEQRAHHDSLWADYLTATGEAKTVAARRCYQYMQTVVNV